MWNLIIKNLWQRRRRNGWLLAELILVTVLSWVMFDPLVVLIHDMSLPMNYDYDRLCMVDLAVHKPGSAHYHEADTDSAAMVNAYLQLVDKAAHFEGVERACPILGFLYPGSQGNGSSMICAEGDTTYHSTVWVQFITHSGFFETYGFRPGKGRTLEELSDYNYGEDDMVITEDVSEMLFGTPDARGHNVLMPYGDTVRAVPLVGTVGDFKLYKPHRYSPTIFYPMDGYNMDYFESDAHILVRLREGVSQKKFLEEFRNWMYANLKSGNLYPRKIYSYDTLLQQRVDSMAMPVIHRSVLLALFFLINMCLGVIGTFWLQTRSRREEVGVLLSFGGSPSYIVRLLLGEGAVLTLIAACIGHAIYLTYQHFWGEGFTKTLTWVLDGKEYWLDDYTLHALGVGAIITVVLLLVVLIGVYIPARAASRVNPVEALRDE
jgi:hypothetical protein